MRRFLTRVLATILLAPFALTLLWFVFPPVSAVMLESLFTGHGMHREWVSMRHISQPMIVAALASEDGRFCEHDGIDWEAVDKAMEENEHSRKLHGASTITMQVAKNLFLWNDRDWLRKALEAPLALWLDFAWSKRRILETYLNIAQWGDGTFGVELASERAFGKAASELTPHEAALLITVLPDPLRRHAAAPSPYHAGLAYVIEGRMAKAPGIAACVRHGGWR